MGSYVCICRTATDNLCSTKRAYSPPSCFDTIWMANKEDKGSNLSGCNMRSDTAPDSTYSAPGHIATLADLCLLGKLDAGQEGCLVSVDQSADDLIDMCHWTTPAENILCFCAAYRCSSCIGSRSACVGCCATFVLYRRILSPPPRTSPVAPFAHFGG